MARKWPLQRHRALALAMLLTGHAASLPAATTVVQLRGAGFLLATNKSVRDGDAQIVLSLNSRGLALPFNQSAVRQTLDSASHGPDPRRPHFVVRFALPIPPDNDTNQTGRLTGLDPEVWAHNHSPGFEALPNGDLLAIYFSARVANGEAESAPDTRFIQARLRHGAEQWDPPELFCDFEGMNDQSALLWQDGDQLRFFGGGRGTSPMVPFKSAYSTNNGATWIWSLPQLDKPATDYTAQPIVNAFRGDDDRMFLAMDAKDDGSFLWGSADGIRWSDVGGRTGARHSTIVPLDARGNLLSVGGKNQSLEGWTPLNASSDGGKSWSESRRAPFPGLGTNQRPSLTRLANGHLVYVSDSYNRRTGTSPDGWSLGQGCFVAVSTNNGAAWHFKRFPVELPHEKDRKSGTLGYATVRQSPNGLIHVLATMTHPCLHYEFNEAWVFSDAGEVEPETNGGRIEKYRENHSNGSPRATWSARVCPNGRYLLEGTAISYHPNGRREHEARYLSGRLTGVETFWAPDGTRIWSWKHDAKNHSATWTHHWPNGRARIESTWNSYPEARDLNRRFIGRVADGPTRHWTENGSVAGLYFFKDGELMNETPVKRTEAAAR